MPHFKAIFLWTCFRYWFLSVYINNCWILIKCKSYKKILIIKKKNLFGFFWCDIFIDVCLLQALETSVGVQIEVNSPAKNCQYFQSVRKGGMQYNVGDCCYIHPDAFSFAIKPAKPTKIKSERKVPKCIFCMAFACKYEQKINMIKQNVKIVKSH